MSLKAAASEWKRSAGVSAEFHTSGPVKASERRIDSITPASIMTRQSDLSDVPGATVQPVINPSQAQLWKQETVFWSSATNAAAAAVF